MQLLVAFVTIGDIQLLKVFFRTLKLFSIIPVKFGIQYENNLQTRLKKLILTKSSLVKTSLEAKQIPKRS
jgi:hypothetical protein